MNTGPEEAREDRFCLAVVCRWYEQGSGLWLPGISGAA